MLLNGCIKRVLIKNPHVIVPKQLHFFYATSATENISIGNVKKDVKSVKTPQYVPRNYYNDDVNQSTLHHLRWMMQKDVLGQDVFLLGPPGPRKRQLAMQYLELTNREHEYVALSRDTTESDLKQRREILKGTAKYFDQSAVKAAVEGRVLVLEGIEKAERNVLPVLNNLLENREMHLEDGRLLIPSKRYDELLQKYSKEELEKWKLVRVNEDFRVIALGLPVPKYRGNPLDPPLRSRFQARDVNAISYQEWIEQLNSMAPNAPKDKLEQLLSVAIGTLSKESEKLGLPDFPIDNLPKIASILNDNPQIPLVNLLQRLYPYKLFLKDGTKALETLWTSLKVDLKEEPKGVSPLLKPLLASDGQYIETEYQNRVIEDMLQTFKVSDFCIIGPRGCGKSALVNKIAQITRKEIESIVLYQDMTSRDLIQQRTTLENGDTVWKLSPLIDAALHGRIAVLDGLHRIHPSTLSVLHRLVHDREIQLHDGKRLINAERFNLIQREFNLSDEEMLSSGVLKIHPDFRIVAIADPPALQGTASANWLSPEVLSLFVFHEVRPLTKQEEMNIITSKYGPIPPPLYKLINLAHELRENQDQTLRNLSGHLSTRQLLRISSRMAKFPADNVYSTVEKTFMTKFLPSLVKEALEKYLKKLDIHEARESEKSVQWKIENNVLTIGKTSANIYKTDALTKVPSVLFYDVPQHINLMERLLQDFQLGQHLLLVGNQGVGKNKIVDRFLELLNRPREYIQLHRDTTVQTLTIQPTVKDGLLVYEDSPLVKAIKNGHVLVVDEADKAPTHVTCILKTLVETGQMVLSDGRRILPHNASKIDDSCIKTHEDFRVIVLANRPGFPFLGNDFFGALGDLFSSHAVDNPAVQSEIDMLKQYGPNVPDDIIRKLVAVFDELRTLSDQGLVNYPYSTREVVNIVKHLQKFPNSDIEDVVFNVFDFDRYSPEMIDTLGQILFKHGFSSKNVFTDEYIKAKRAKEYLQVTKERQSGLDTKGPKHGKEDPKNEPHVGGNTWAGGTGGRDTAGLGGKGGPYRLDKGHTVHQLSDEEKAAVPEHIQKAAREMGRKAFQERLKEIGMSNYDASLYSEFSNAVARQVQSLRMILSSLQAKNKERNWYRHQTSGELDDVKLIDGILGEKTIYRRRSEKDPELGAPQLKPKYFRVLVDVSGSMYRFNSYDGRLDRELEAVVLIMEAFEGFSDKIKYDILGHSGESDKIVFVKKDEPPKNNKERLDIIRTMHAHTQYCWSGDNTLEATEHAISTLTEEDADESILVMLSDANLSRYNIPADRLGRALTADPKISAYAIFIGSLGDQAERLTQRLPAGRSFICQDVSTLPQILKQIFSSSLVNTTESS